MTARWPALVFLGILGLPGQAAAEPALDLAEVLATLSSHPILAAGDAAMDRADGLIERAEGAFDTVVRARVESAPVGFYEFHAADVELRQPTQTGVSGFAGYRIGSGDLPIYDWKLRTLDGGEARAGLTVPVLRDRSIDPARAELWRSQAGGKVARLDRRQLELALGRDAAIAYWRWAGAFEKLDVRSRQLQVARDRDAGLQSTIAQGNTAPIEGVDNRRVVVAREATVVTARRDVEVTMLDLQWFVRDPRGAMQEIAAVPVPLPQLPALGAHDPTRELGAARTRLPIFALLDLRMLVLGVDLDLATNQQLPRLEANVFVSRGFGTRDDELKDREETRVAAVLSFELPFQQRAARGAQRAARAEQRRVRADTRAATDRVFLDLRVAYADYTAAHERARLATEQAALALQLANAERTRFERGDSSILFVNLREDAQADAEAAAIDAQVDVLVADARARFVRGEPAVAE